MFGRIVARVVESVVVIVLATTAVTYGPGLLKKLKEKI